MNIQYVGMLNAIGLFIIVGVGVDDVFVFYDSWMQERHIRDREVRISKVYRRATKATFITSFTTAAAFTSNLFSPIPALRLFGIFMSLLVVINFVRRQETWFIIIIEVD